MRTVTVAQARRELASAGEQTILMTPEEQLTFWQAPLAPGRQTRAQKRLGKLMQGET